MSELIGPGQPCYECGETYGQHHHTCSQYPDNKQPEIIPSLEIVEGGTVCGFPGYTCRNLLTYPKSWIEISHRLEDQPRLVAEAFGRLLETLTAKGLLNESDLGYIIHENRHHDVTFRENKLG